MRGHRNLTVACINEPVGKLISLYIIWLQIQELISARTLRGDLLYSPFRGGCSQNNVPGPAGSVPPDNLLHMQILRPHARLTEWEVRGWGQQSGSYSLRAILMFHSLKTILFYLSLLASNHFGHRQVQTSKPVSFPWLQAPALCQFLATMGFSSLVCLPCVLCLALVILVAAEFQLHVCVRSPVLYFSKLTSCKSQGPKA